MRRYVRIPRAALASAERHAILGANPVTISSERVIRRASGFERRGAGGWKDSAMSQPAKAQEPSMEEILASIRRIIADDDPAKPAAAQPRVAARRRVLRQCRRGIRCRRCRPPAAPPPSATMDQARNRHDAGGARRPAGRSSSAAEDVLDLTEQMAAPAEAEAPSFQTIDGQTDVFFADAPPEPCRG